LFLASFALIPLLAAMFVVILFPAIAPVTSVRDGFAERRRWSSVIWGTRSS
jgi:hypothetical protein